MPRGAATEIRLLTAHRNHFLRLPGKGIHSDLASFIYTVRRCIARASTAQAAVHTVPSSPSDTVGFSHEIPVACPVSCRSSNLFQRAQTYAELLNYPVQGMQTYVDLKVPFSQV